MPVGSDQDKYLAYGVRSTWGSAVASSIVNLKTEVASIKKLAMPIAAARSSVGTGAGRQGMRIAELGKATIMRF